MKAQYKNNLKLADHFYDNPDLQDAWRGIYLGAFHTTQLYSDTWTTLAKGQATTIV